TCARRAFGSGPARATTIRITRFVSFQEDVRCALAHQEEEQRLKESANGTERRLTALLGIVMATPGGGQQCSAPLRHHAVRRGLILHVRRGLKTTSRLVPTGRGVRGGQRVLGRSN